MLPVANWPIKDDLNFEMNQLREALHSFANFFFFQPFQSFITEFFYTEGSHSRAVNDGPFHIFKRKVSCFCQIADEASGKGVNEDAVERAARGSPGTVEDEDCARIEGGVQ